MWVKVCGITTRSAAEAAVDAGTDAIGLVLMESPRQVDVERARQIGQGLDVERIALLDVESADLALVMLAEVGATGVQPYGAAVNEIAEAAVDHGYFVLRPVRVVGAMDLSVLPPEQLPLLDTADATLRGGTGRAFDWSLVGDLDRPVVIAGGLDPHNVSQLIHQIGPWGVDASSRLESSPGRKDPELVRAFVTAAKQRAPQP